MFRKFRGCFFGGVIELSGLFCCYVGEVFVRLRGECCLCTEKILNCFELLIVVLIYAIKISLV